MPRITLARCQDSWSIPINQNHDLPLYWHSLKFNFTLNWAISRISVVLTLIDLKFGLNSSARRTIFEWFRFKMLTKWVGLRKSRSSRVMQELLGSIAFTSKQLWGAPIAFPTNFEPLDDPWGVPHARFVIKLSGGFYFGWILVVQLLALCVTKITTTQNTHTRPIWKLH